MLTSFALMASATVFAFLLSFCSTAVSDLRFSEEFFGVVVVVIVVVVIVVVVVVVDMVAVVNVDDALFDLPPNSVIL